MDGPTRNGDGDRRSTPTATGVTLVGVVLSIAVTVTFGLSVLPWWARVAIGAGVGAGLLAAIKLGTRQGRDGALARLARWITSDPG